MPHPPSPEDKQDSECSDLIQKKNPGIIQRWRTAVIWLMAGIGLGSAGTYCSLKKETDEHGPRFALVEVLPRSELEHLHEMFSEKKQGGITLDSRGFITLSIDLNRENLPVEIQQLVDQLRGKIPDEKSIHPWSLRFMGKAKENQFNRVELTYKNQAGQGGIISEPIPPDISTRMLKRVTADLQNGDFRPGLRFE